MRLRLSPRARIDLDEIWNYSARAWSVEQAEAYLDALGQTLALLTANPRLGRDAGDIRPGYLKFPTASHVIYYRLSERTLDVIRILHRSMDAGRHL
jgi:toxin ParE1/3/4